MSRIYSYVSPSTGTKLQGPQRMLVFKDISENYNFKEEEITEVLERFIHNY
jgi:hypothetical protein